MSSLRKLRVVLPLVAVVVLAAQAAAVEAAPRMPVGFYDDPSFRWSPDTSANLAAAARANASIVHVLADWASIAPTKPRRPLNGNDPAYHLSDLDSLVRTAQENGLQVLVTIAETPGWANGGQTPNHPPKRLVYLTQFAHMLAARYNGKHPGFGVVNYFAVWNEPNLQLFLTPQFKGSKIVSPAIYAKLYMAAYKGIKAGNRKALVAAGETSNRGHNHPTGKVSDSVAPATFARLLAKAAPHLPFDAWSTHPYPSVYALGPTQRVRYPNVAFSTMNRFGKDLQKWFHRRVPIWITEYGEQTKPEYAGGVTYAQQARDVKKALRLAVKDPYVEMFIWFIFRDSTSQTWFSGVETKSGRKKPAYTAFQRTARGIVGQTQVVAPGKPFKVTIPVPHLTYYDGHGARIGITYKVLQGRKVVAVDQPVARIAVDGTVTFRVDFAPVKKKRYTLVAFMNDANGQTEQKFVGLIPPG